MKHEIALNSHTLPILESTAFLHAARPFIHGDRILEMHDMIYLVSGSMQVIEDGVEYLLTPGNVLFLKAGVHHWGTENCAPNTSWYYVHFILPQSEGPVTDNPLRLPKFLSGGKDIQLEKQLQELAELFQDKHPLQQALCNAKLYQLLLSCCKRDLQMQQVSPIANRISQIMDYLEAHQNQSLDTAALAAHMNLSYKHLGILFKKNTGRTILEYHTELRMQTAARLLRETDLSVTQISEQLGFGDAFYFSNTFKKIHHQSPRDYRKSLF